MTREEFLDFAQEHNATIEKVLPPFTLQAVVFVADYTRVYCTINENGTIDFFGAFNFSTSLAYIELLYVSTIHGINVAFFNTRKDVDCAFSFSFAVSDEESDIENARYEPLLDYF